MRGLVIPADMELENREMIEKLADHNLKKFLKVMLENDHECYTKKGRLNKSAVCRLLHVNALQLDAILERCKKILGREFPE